MKVKNGGGGGWPERVSPTVTCWLCKESTAKQSGSSMKGGGGRWGRRHEEGQSWRVLTGLTGRRRIKASVGSFFLCYKPSLLCRVATSRTEEEPLSNVQYRVSVNWNTQIWFQDKAWLLHFTPSWPKTKQSMHAARETLITDDLITTKQV